MILATLYRATGFDYYFRIVRKLDGIIYDNDSDELAAAPSWANSAIAMPEVSDKGQYPITIPDDVPAGNYDVVVYVGAAPANTDEREIGLDLRVGSIFGF